MTMDLATRSNVLVTLRDYGASLSENNQIVSAGGKLLGVIIKRDKRRLKFVSAYTGKLLASGNAGYSSEAVKSFVEEYWFWEKVKV